MKLCGVFVYHVFLLQYAKKLEAKFRHICTVVLVLES